jgi:hypothetical protein
MKSGCLWNGTVFSISLFRPGLLVFKKLSLVDTKLFKESGNKACTPSVSISKTTPAGVLENEPSDLSGPKLVQKVSHSWGDHDGHSPCLRLAAQAGQKNGRKRETADLEESNSLITRQQKTH